MSKQTEELMEEIFPTRRSYKEVFGNEVGEDKTIAVVNKLGDELHKELDDNGEPISGYLQKKHEEQKQDITSREQFYIWLATPQFLRNPQQKKALAKKLLVSTKTLDNWEKDLEEYDSKLFFLANKVSIDRAILKKAKEGSFYHAKLAKELSGEYTPKQEITHKVLSADDIDRLTKQAEDEHRAGVLGISAVSPEPNLLSQ